MMFAVSAAMLVIAACETPAPKPPPPSPPPPAAPVAAPKPAPAPTPKPAPVVVAPPPPAKAPGQIALDEGVTLYDAGDYPKSLRALQSVVELPDATVPIKVSAHKHMALIYCVTSRRPLCRQSFAEALKLDAAFALEPAERSHPIWGAEYDAAKKGPAAAPAKPVPKPAPKPKPKPVA